MKKRKSFQLAFQQLQRFVGSLGTAAQGLETISAKIDDVNRESFRAGGFRMLHGSADTTKCQVGVIFSVPVARKVVGWVLRIEEQGKGAVS